MNVVLYAATGNIGRRILAELQSRGHNVTAAVRNPANLPAGLHGVQDDLSSVDRIAEVIAGADAVISAYGPPPTDPGQLSGVIKREIAAIEKVGGKSGKPRLIVVGGAASLEVAPGVTLLASGHLPEAWMPIATAHAEALQLLRNSDINWTYFSPAAFIQPGERTGKFRLGTETLVTDASGESRISIEDYAVALVDELEQPKHERSRFTIGY